jgi:cell division topological specificity factor
MMNLPRLFTGRTASASAPVARERLQILLAHERGLRGQPDLLELLRAEILATVSRHVMLDPEKVVVRMDRGNHVSTLEIDIEVPMTAETNRDGAPVARYG